MNYDGEIAKLVDEYAKTLGMMAGKPADRIRAAKRKLVELTDAVKKLVREETLEFYEQKKAASPEPLLTPQAPQTAPPYVPQPPPDARPPIRGEDNRESASYLGAHP